MKKKILGILAILLILNTQKSLAHCEIPCGIYHDDLRIHLIEEYIDTIEKSMVAINELSKNKDPLSINQLVRWVDNKEEHAKKIQYIIWQYFFTQRVKPVDPNDKERYKVYLRELELLNRLNFLAMKSKQSVDTKVVKEMRKVLAEFEKLYFKNKKHKH